KSSLLEVRRLIRRTGSCSSSHSRDRPTINQIASTTNIHSTTNMRFLAVFLMVALVAGTQAWSLGSLWGAEEKLARKDRHIDEDSVEDLEEDIEDEDEEDELEDDEDDEEEDELEDDDEDEDEDDLEDDDDEDEDDEDLEDDDEDEDEDELDDEDEDEEEDDEE
ncbi:unnamed protein product, partial [Meganyctiphanes norvegica]